MMDRRVLLREALWDRKKSQIPEVRPMFGRIYPGLLLSGQGDPLLFDHKKRLLRTASAKLVGPTPGQRSADDGAQCDHEAAQGPDVAQAVLRIFPYTEEDLGAAYGGSGGLFAIVGR